MLISSSNCAKRHINVCPGGDLCSPFFSNFSETPCVKIGFEDFLRLMNEGRYLEGGRFHFLLSSLTLLLLQGGHKPGKLREFVKLSKSQGKLREI